MLTNKTTKLSYQIFKYLLNSPQINSKWIVSVQTLLSNAGRQDIWLNQNESTPKSTGKLIKQALIDQLFQQCNSQLDTSSKGRSYSIFKNNINCERYLHILTGQSAMTMSKFRTGNHKFPVEVGRWNGIDLSERKCNLCLSNNIGDELHYLLECTFFDVERRTHIGKYYHQRPNVIKYKQLLETTQEKKLIKLGKFMNLIIKYVGNSH